MSVCVCKMMWMRQGQLSIYLFCCVQALMVRGCTNLRQLVLQHLLRWPYVSEEDMEEVSRGLGVDLLFAQVDV